MTSPCNYAVFTALLRNVPQMEERDEAQVDARRGTIAGRALPDTPPPTHRHVVLQKLGALQRVSKLFLAMFISPDVMFKDAGKVYLLKQVHVPVRLYYFMPCVSSALPRFVIEHIISRCNR
jgi:hypothetical protein